MSEVHPTAPVPADKPAKLSKPAQPYAEFPLNAHVESEASLLGVVFSDAGAMTSAAYEVVAQDHWVFAGTGLKRGDLFGTRILHQRYGAGGSGHETDKISPFSPKNVLRRFLACGAGGRPRPSA
jgi:hypothetical protein